MKGNISIQAHGCTRNRLPLTQSRKESGASYRVTCGIITRREKAQKSWLLQEKAGPCIPRRCMLESRSTGRWFASWADRRECESPKAKWAPMHDRAVRLDYLMKTLRWSIKTHSCMQLVNRSLFHLKLWIIWAGRWLSMGTWVRYPEPTLKTKQTRMELVVNTCVCSAREAEADRSAQTGWAARHTWLVHSRPIKDPVLEKGGWMSGGGNTHL